MIQELEKLEKIEEVVANSSWWQTIKEFLHFSVEVTDKVHISVLNVLVFVTLIFITTLLLRVVLGLITKKLPEEEKGKFTVVYGYFRWLVYLIILMIAFDSVGVNVTTLLAASAGLLIGVGLALQTLFQDIISGVFILVDQTVHVGDIIELEGKVGRVEEIKLRTTRAVTIDNKVLIIPNHLYLENSLYNWTQNGTSTRESVAVGVAYGSDVQLVKKLLIEAANSHPQVIEPSETAVRFDDFGDSSLNFRVIFTIGDSFNANMPKSDIRFEIDRLFREHNISIPFPQRDIHIIQNPNQSVNLNLKPSGNTPELGNQ